ncbi:MAG: CCA tRNA nucleotidyltransferase [Deltaproteobacteria bacterium]|nr:CCA tRNA nucleotidyltransferase [Deltaproteobacteria bacterium]
MVSTKFDFQIPDNVVRICKTLNDNGEEGYLVGGSLRDLILGKAPGDWDLATTATPEKMMKLFRRVIPTGIDHGTVTVLIKGETYEITTLRSEQGYTDGRHPDSVRFVTNIDEDLSRRDFTVNAIAWNPLSRQIFDPFGGRADLVARRIVAVGDARARFEEDGLRIMRAARFAATLEFEVEETTRCAIREFSHRLENVSVERKRDEFQKMLLARQPSLGLRILLENAVFKYVCPIVDQTEKKDDWTRVLQLVDAVYPEFHLRLATLLVDADDGVRIAWMDRFLIDKRTKKQVSHLLSFFPFSVDEALDERSLRRFVSRVGKIYMADFLLLLDAHATAGWLDAKKVESFNQAVDALDWRNAPLSVADLAVNGADLIRELHTAPGPHIGDLLNELLAHVIDTPADNQRDILLAMARSRNS